MFHRKGVKRPDYVYPAEAWRLVEKRFYPRLLAQGFQSSTELQAQRPEG